MVDFRESLGRMEVRWRGIRRSCTGEYLDINEDLTNVGNLRPARNERFFQEKAHHKMVGSHYIQFNMQTGLKRVLCYSSIDMWGLGCLIWEVFNGPLSQQSSLKILEKVRCFVLIPFDVPLFI